jgi:hypothetical protein
VLRLGSTDTFNSMQLSSQASLAISSASVWGLFGISSVSGHGLTLDKAVLSLSYARRKISCSFSSKPVILRDRRGFLRVFLECGPSSAERSDYIIDHVKTLCKERIIKHTLALLESLVGIGEELWV